MRVIGNRILVEVNDYVDVDTPIALTGSQKVPMKATVLSVGNLVELPVTVGQRVVIQNKAGEDITEEMDVEEGEFRVVTEADIICYTNK